MDLESKLITTVQIRNETGVDGNKVKTYGAVFSQRARVEKNRKRSNTGTGSSWSSSWMIYTTTEIPESSLVWLAGEATTDETTGRTAKAQAEYPSLTGAQTLFVYDLEKNRG